MKIVQTTISLRKLVLEQITKKLEMLNIVSDQQKTKKNV